MHRLLKILTIGLIWITSVTAVSAATVTIPASGYFGSGPALPGLTKNPATSAWQYAQNGFVMDIHRYSTHPAVNELPPALGVISSNGLYGYNPTLGFTFRQAAGKLFGLRNIDISTVYSGVAGWYERSITGGASTPLNRSIIPFFYNAVSLSAVRADGSVINRTFSPWCPDTGLADLHTSNQFGFFPGCSQNRDTVFDATDFGAGFGSIKSFTLDILPTPGLGFSGTDPAALHLAMKDTPQCSPLNLARVDASTDFAAICAGTPLLINAPSFWYTDSNSLLGQRNDDAAIWVASINVAPIPLPASLPVFAIAIAAMAFRRRRSGRWI